MEKIVEVKVKVDEKEGIVENDSGIEVGIEMVKGDEWMLVDVYLNRMRFEEEVRRYGGKVVCLGDHIEVLLWLGVGEVVNLERVLKEEKMVCGLRKWRC